MWKKSAECGHVNKTSGSVNLLLKLALYGAAALTSTLF